MKLQIPIGHAVLFLGPQDLVELGVGYTHMAPAPSLILMNDMRRRVSEARGGIDPGKITRRRRQGCMLAYD